VPDIGSDTGRLTAMCRDALPAARITGIDPAPTMVAAARKKFAGDPAVTFQSAGVEDLSSFADGSFDAAITSVMGPPDDPDRAADVLDLLTCKAVYYLRHASFERMLLQIDLLPRFMRQDGEILTTAEYWRETLLDTGFSSVEIVTVEPADLYNRIIVGVT
jgi:SAM-dependent methyltransferase